jgi:hypothetical protein
VLVASKGKALIDAGIPIKSGVEDDEDDAVDDALSELELGLEADEITGAVPMANGPTTC